MSNAINKSLKFNKFIYLAAGGAAFVVDYLVFLFSLSIVGAPLFVANAIGLVAGFIISFLANRQLTFRKPADKEFRYQKRAQVIIYCLLLAFNTVFSYILILLFVALLSIDPSIGKVVAMIAIVIWNYFVYERIIFRHEKK